MGKKVGYCPLCNREFEFITNNCLGHCPECGHHLALHEIEEKNEEKRQYKVITLCGSTKFKDEFMEAQKRLTLAGYIVISVGLFGHSGDDEVWTEGTKEMLDDMHKRKIDMADEIFVINVNGYIGSSTRSEIDYAIRHGKRVRYLMDCGMCEEFIGGGDWNLCCNNPPDDVPAPCGWLCYEDSPACKNFKMKK